MFFRFGGAVILCTLIALAGIALEKRTLDLRRQVSHQSYRQEVLLEDYARQRLEAQRLGAPAQLLDDLTAAELTAPGGRPPAPVLPPAKSAISTQADDPADPR